jgi:hypothetical protein
MPEAHGDEHHGEIPWVEDDRAAAGWVEEELLTGESPCISSAADVSGGAGRRSERPGADAARTDIHVPQRRDRSSNGCLLRR